MRESPLLRRGRSWRRLPIAAILLLAALPARAQDSAAQDLSANERRCTGQWRATSEERIASCTTLIDSGRYQPAVIDVLTLDGAKIAAVTAFLLDDSTAAETFASFGLPTDPS